MLKHSRLMRLILWISVGLWMLAFAPVYAQGQGDEPAWLGVQLQDLKPDEAAAIGRPSLVGAKVTIVSPSSPADRAGLKPGDVIVSVDQVGILDAASLSTTIKKLRPSDTINLQIVRSSKRLTKKVTLRSLANPGFSNRLDDIQPLESHIELLTRMGRTQDAVPLARQLYEIARKELGVNDPYYARLKTILARTLWGAGLYQEAERTLFELNKRYREVFGKENDAVYADLGVLYLAQGRLGEARSAFIKAIELESGLNIDALLSSSNSVDMKKNQDINGFNLAMYLANVADVYDAELKHAAAIDFRQRSIPIIRRFFADGHPITLTINRRLGYSLMRQGRLTDSTALLENVRTLEKSSPDATVSDAIETLNYLALSYLNQGMIEEAGRRLELADSRSWLTQRTRALYLMAKSQNVDAVDAASSALAMAQRLLGEYHHEVATCFEVLATAYSVVGNVKATEDAARMQLRLLDKIADQRHLARVVPLGFLGAALAQQGRLAEAEAVLIQASDLEQVRKKFSSRHYDSVDRDWSLKGSFANAVSANLMKVQFLNHAQRSEGFKLASATSFRLAQAEAVTSAGVALQAMLARIEGGGGKLSELVRLRQDLVRRWEWLTRNTQLLKSGGDVRAALGVGREVASAITDVELQLDKLNDQLADQYPDYRNTVDPPPVDYSTVQTEIGPRDAVVLMFGAPRLGAIAEETFIWVVTKDEARWVRSALGPKSLAEKLEALRCGLDEELWAYKTSQGRCATLLGIDVPGSAEPLPFNLGIAHELYTELFGQVGDLIAGKRLLIVPTGSLTSLPFHVLVTKKPEIALPNSFEGYRGISWLGRQHAISVLPSVSSVKTLRPHNPNVAGSRAYIGYGNPVLVGDGNCREVRVPDQCPRLEPSDVGPKQIVSDVGGQGRATIRGRSGRRSSSIEKIFPKGAGPDAVLANVRSLCPLPDTAFEIRCVAERLGINSTIKLEAAATEEDLKELSTKGTLSSYRVVHFATHGLLAGDVEMMAKRRGEPALVLSPPRSPKGMDDDGLLTASEITQLKLNADWVVLSACNTASADNPGAEALSGLARAFFYAGARSLLVSHWPVYSDAAVRLATRTFLAADHDKTIGRASALQIAMNELMDDYSQSDNAHPAVWAPFALVGEGADSK